MKYDDVDDEEQDADADADGEGEGDGETSSYGVCFSISFQISRIKTCLYATATLRNPTHLSLITLMFA